MASSHLASSALFIALAVGQATPAFANFGDEFDYECEAQWVASSASKSCGALTLFQSPKGVCVLIATCKGADKQSTTAWTLDSLSKLVNQNGVLGAGVSRPLPSD